MSNRNRTTTERDDLYESVNNDGKCMYFFTSEADARAAEAGERGAFSKKLALAGFSHPKRMGYGGIEAIDRKKVVAHGTLKQVWAIVLDNVGEVDVDVDDDWGEDAPEAPVEAGRKPLPF